MGIKIERYFDGINLEIMLKLPQGDSYIIASKNDNEKYVASVYLPWLVLRGGIDAFGFEDEIDKEYLQEIINAPSFELIKIIRKCLPIMKERLE